jgi:hypothetical protein
MVRDERFLKSGRLHSEAKIELFYKSVIAVLMATMVLIGLTGGVCVGAKKDCVEAKPAAAIEKTE